MPRPTEDLLLRKMADLGEPLPPQHTLDPEAPPPDFASMTNAELRAHALKYRDDSTALHVLFSRATPTLPNTASPTPKQAAPR